MRSPWVVPLKTIGLPTHVARMTHPTHSLSAFGFGGSLGMPPGMERSGSIWHPEKTLGLVVPPWENRGVPLVEPFWS